MISIAAWDYFHSGDGSCDAMAKKIAAFYPCLKSFLEAMLKSYINCFDKVSLENHHIEFCLTVFNKHRKVKK